MAEKSEQDSLASNAHVHADLRIPDHELLRVVGRGSYGEVWLARNVMGTYRAIKLVYRSQFKDSRPFEREFSGIKSFEPVSRTHEGLVHVLQVGRNDAEGYFYYVMELADDACSGAEVDPDHYAAKTIATELIERRRLGFDECLNIGLSLSAALGHLHKAGLVHRDIKPSNVIFVRGAPKLADVGLVAAASEAQSYVGTEGFIPPEGPGTQQADIYSLGKVLYEISTGKDRQQFPEPLTVIPETESAVDLVELNEVVLRACETDVRKRYQTAEEMRSDLLLLQGGKSVKRLHAAERRLALLTRLGLVMLLVGVLILAGLIETNRERRAVTQALVRLHVANGTRLMNEGNLFESLLSFTEALRLDAGNSKHEDVHRIRIGTVLEQCPKLVGLFQHEQRINEGVFTGDARRLITASDDHTAKVWDLATGSNLFTLMHPGLVYSVAVSPNNRWILTTSTDPSPHFWDAASGQPTPRPEIRHIGQWVRPEPKFSADSARVLTLPEFTAAQVWDISSGSSVGAALRHVHKVSGFDFSPDGRAVVTLDVVGRAHVWDASSGKLLFETPPAVPINSASFSPDSHVLMTADDGGFVRFWEMPSGKSYGRSLEHGNGVSDVMFSPEGERVLTRCSDLSIQLWDYRTGKPLLLPIAQTLPAFSTGFSPDGRSIVASSGGNVFRSWDADTGEAQLPTLRHSNWRGPVVWGDGGRLMLTMRRDEARVWDMGKIQPRPVLIRPADFFKQDAYSTNGRYKATIQGENTVHTLDRKSGKILPQPIAQAAQIRRVWFGGEDDLLLSESADTRLRIWDLLTGEPLSPPLVTRYDVNAPLLSRRDLAQDPRPISDLVLLAQLLSGNRLNASGGSYPLEPDELVNAWTKLRARYPETFNSTSNQIAQWRDQEARSSEGAWNWWSAIFHLDRLLANYPQNASLQHRREYAELALTRVRESGLSYAAKRRKIPPRDPAADERLIDLSPYYNSSRRDHFESVPMLPCGLQQLGGKLFDIRGVIQLSSAREKANGSTCPERVDGIKIGKHCQHLYFLHAATFETHTGARIGEYIIHYANGKSTRIPIIYGKDVRNWWTLENEPVTTRGSTLVWTGTNPIAGSPSKALRLFMSTWQNPYPSERVDSMDFVSSMIEPAPFLVALSLDP